MQNRVLDHYNRLSSEFYKNYKVLQHYLQSSLSLSSLTFFSEFINQLGPKAATQINELSQRTDRLGLQLTKRNFYGENIDEIVFHPAYAKMIEIAVGPPNFLPEMGARYQHLLRH
jgi:acyl-CoA dehydrogenase